MPLAHTSHPSDSQPGAYRNGAISRPSAKTTSMAAVRTSGCSPTGIIIDRSKNSSRAPAACWATAGGDSSPAGSCEASLINGCRPSCRLRADSTNRVSSPPAALAGMDAHAASGDPDPSSVVGTAVELVVGLGGVSVVGASVVPLADAGDIRTSNSAVSTAATSGSEGRRYSSVSAAFPAATVSNVNRSYPPAPTAAAWGAV